MDNRKKNCRTQGVKYAKVGDKDREKVENQRSF